MSGIWARALLVVALLSSLVISTTSSPVAATHDPTPVTVTITRLRQIGTDIDPGVFQGPVGDFYAGVTIDGTTLDNFDDRLDFGFEFGTGFIFPFTINLRPFWVLSQTVTSDDATATVAIEIWDNDDCDTPFCDDTGLFESNDDQVDVSPSGSETLTLTVNKETGRWSGDVAWPQNCVAGTGGEAVEVCFDISVDSSSGDADGDSLLDTWETDGLNIDGDADIDLDLAALGADPLRADIFVEVDCMVSDGNGNGTLTDLVDHTQCPTNGAMTDVVQAFANAPTANPDGTTGVQLHLDTGTLFGPGVAAVVGTGGVSGSVGDLGGGGDQIPEVTTVSWDGSAGSTNFYTIKNANFDFDREFVFRYGLFANQVNARANAFDCTSGWAEDIRANDFIVSLGGRRDLDGNGTGDTECWNAGAANGIDDDGDGAVDEDPLDGIDNDGDCVPGTDTDADMNICDSGDVGVDEDAGFSVGSRSQQAGTFMHELGHTIGLRHGGGDNTNFKPNYLSVMNYLALTSTTPLAGTGGLQSCNVPTSPAGASFPIPGGCDFSRIDVDLDERPAPGLDECFGVGPSLGFGSLNWDGSVAGATMVPTFTGTTCAPPSGNVSVDINGDGSTTALNGFDDWSNLFFAFRDLGNFATGVFGPGPVDADPDDLDDAAELLLEIGHDLSTGVSGPATAIPGDVVTVDFDVTNVGGGPSLGTSLELQPAVGPPDVRDLDAIKAGASATESATFTVPFPIANNTVLTTSGDVSGVDLYGRPETNLSNNAAQHDVVVLTPEMIITKSGPATASAGAKQTFTFDYGNVGGADAVDVVVIDTLPVGLVYNPVDDTGAGPAPDSVSVNLDGTTTLTWNIGTVAPAATGLVEFDVRSSLLVISGTDLENSATATYEDANGNIYDPETAVAAVHVDSGDPSQDPLKWSAWRNDSSLWDSESRARIQATDVRYDGADGSAPDGVLSVGEVDVVLSVGQNPPYGVRSQLLSTYLNLATERIVAGTEVDSRKADAIGADNVAEAAIAAQDILAEPVDRSTRRRYVEVRLALDEINKNKSEQYS